MAVAHDNAVESETTTVGHSSVASVAWTHTPSGTAKGIIVFAYTNANSGNPIETAVDYGGKALATSASYEANDTAGEAGCCRVWFLGDASEIAARSNDTVTVTRTNNTVVSYYVSVTVQAAASMDTAIHDAGVTLQETDGTLAELSITDGSPGTDSVRYAGINSGLGTPPPQGANSTQLHTIDFSARGISTCRRTSAGQGALSVGFSSGTSDDRAAVYFAVKEIAEPTATPPKPTVLQFAVARANRY